MPNTQYSSYPSASYPMMDWSSEISGTRPAAAPSQAGAHATATTSTTTTTTSSASAGPHGAASAPQTTMTTTSTSAAAPAVQSQTAAAPAVQSQTAAAPAEPSQTPSAHRSEFEGSIGTLDLQTHQPIEVVEAPASMNEAFLGSLKSMLLRNRGNFVTATFLIGTQGTTAWEGILHDVGNDYLIIFQPGRHRYIACDIYSLKYIEFYDTRQQDMCEHLLRQNGMNNYY